MCHHIRNWTWKQLCLRPLLTSRVVVLDVLADLGVDFRQIVDYSFSLFKSDIDSSTFFHGRENCGIVDISGLQLVIKNACVREATYFSLQIVQRQN